MSNIILDSCVFISLFNSVDSNHEKATRDFKEIQTSKKDIWITEHIVDEVVNILLKKKLKTQLERFIYYIDDNIIKVFVPSDNSIRIMNQTLSIISKQTTNASYTDIYSIVLLKSKYIDNAEILSYDHHLINLQKTLE